MRRAWKPNNTILRQSRWNVEVGDPQVEDRENNANLGLSESEDNVRILFDFSVSRRCNLSAIMSRQPYVVHRVTRTKLEWRIRNFRYTNDSQYSVTLDDSNEKCIVVRTTDRKFYKKIPLLDFQRLNLTPSQSSLKHSHSLGTLIIQVCFLNCR